MTNSPEISTHMTQTSLIEHFRDRAAKVSVIQSCERSVLNVNSQTSADLWQMWRDLTVKCYSCHCSCGTEMALICHIVMYMYRLEMLIQK